MLNFIVGSLGKDHVAFSEDRGGLIMVPNLKSNGEGSRKEKTDLERENTYSGRGGPSSAVED